MMADQCMIRENFGLFEIVVIHLRIMILIVLLWSRGI